jgi:hypothetical protein
MFQDPSSLLSALFSSDLEDIPKGKNAFLLSPVPGGRISGHITQIAVNKCKRPIGKLAAQRAVL